MKLLSSPSSPFVRKVMITAHMKGVAARIELSPTDTNKGGADFFKQNPLGKIPCLTIDSGEVIFDSHPICEYLDSLAPIPLLFPQPGPARWRVNTLGALGDGMLDAAVLLVYEKRFRPEGFAVQAWVDRQQGKIDRAVDHLAQAPPTWGGHPDYGHITIACALGYLDFRHGGKWRDGRPQLVAWLDAFGRAVPAFEATRPSG